MPNRSENELVEDLYDAALGCRSWEEVNHGLLNHVDGQTLMMSVHRTKTASVEVLGWLGMSGESLQDYPSFAPHDLWAAGYVERRLFGRAAIGSQLVDERTLTRSLIYNEYLRPRVGVFHLVGTVLPMDGGYHAVLGVHRPPDAKDFAPIEARRLARLLPHVQRALEVRRRLQQADQASRSVYSVLDRLRLGAIIMDANGRLQHVNAAADAILQSADGLTRTPDGLRAAHKDDDRRLQHLIGALRQKPGEARSAGGHLRVRRPSGRPAYAVMLAPLGGAAAIGGKTSPALLAFVSDPTKSIASDATVLRDLFGFPSAEAHLVMALLSGIALPEFARQRGVTHNTVRTQLGRAMARTETRSQLELVLLVAASIGGTKAAHSAPSPAIKPPR